jgi:hypothetical protein
MLSEAKHLASTRNKPFASLRVTNEEPLRNLCVLRVSAVNRPLET